MDTQSLAVILQGALSQNRDERKAAEEGLLQVEYAPQHLVRLLQVIVDTNFNLAVRHLASISFKNFVVKNWAPNCLGEQSKILLGDKAAVREITVNIFAGVPPLLRAQLSICLENIISVDYPQEWPGLLQRVKQKLQGQDVYSDVFVLRLIFKRLKIEKRRTLAYQVIDETFPGLLNIFKRNVELAFANTTIEVADLVKLICKIFLSSIYIGIPKMLVDPNVLKAWMVCFMNLLEMSVPADGQPVDPEQRKSWGWWKVKKWTVRILNRLCICFGGHQNSDYKAIALSFQNKFAVKILDCYLNLLNAIPVGGYLPDRVISSILQFLTVSISESKIYDQLELRLDVLFETIFPLVCFDDYDQILWDEDQHEYMYKQNDFIHCPTPKSTAMSFLIELIEHGRKNLPKFLVFFYKVCSRYNEATAEQKPYRQKDGALYAIGTILYKLTSESFKSELELIFVEHVFPEFQSTVGHLRAQAAWITGQCASFSFMNPDNYHHALHSVVGGMYDIELPVRIESIVAVCYFLDCCKDLAVIRPIVPQLLDELFKIMSEADSEEFFVETVLRIVEKFPEEIAPRAIELCHNLASTFWKHINTGVEAAEDEEADVAVSCLRAINTILKAVSSQPELFPHIEPALLPIIHTMLDANIKDSLKETFEIITCLTSFSPTISLEMWSLLPLITDALSDWAIDLYSDSFALLANYISRGTAYFLSCKEPDYQLSLWMFISTMMDYKDLKDSDKMIAPKLIQVIFENCRGQVNQWVDLYLTITLKCMPDTAKPHLKCLLMEVVAAALYYNAPLALKTIRKLDAATEVFNIWFQLLQETEKSGVLANFKRKEDKKVCCLGLISLLTLPADQLPIEELEGIFKSAVDILIAYMDQVLEASIHAIEWDDDEDPFIFFLDTAKAMQESDSLRFQNLMETLDWNHHKNANVVAQYAEKRRE